jgi:class 3 adenylate cyclase
LFDSFEQRPEDAFDFVNEYLQRQTQVVIEAGGVFQKYAFDGAFYSFNVPVPVKSGDHAVMAVETAVRLQEDFANLKNSWMRTTGKDLTPLYNRIGIACGELYKREMGHPRHEQLMILGKVIGDAAHLCGAATRDHHVIVVDGVVEERLPRGFERKRVMLTTQGEQELFGYELVVNSA